MRKGSWQAIVGQEGQRWVGALGRKEQREVMVQSGEEEGEAGEEGGGEGVRKEEGMGTKKG
jgi:hypothetical protein